MKLPGTCSVLKESHDIKDGTPFYWLGRPLFIKGESPTPTFKILVRTVMGLELLSTRLVSSGKQSLCLMDIWNNVTFCLDEPIQCIV